LEVVKTINEMKNKMKYGLFLLAIVLVAVSVSSCGKKTDYYNYENKVKSFDGSTLEYVKNNPKTFDTLIKILNRIPDLEEALANEEITFFAPVNESFVSSFKYLNQQRLKANPSAENITVDNADVTELTTMLAKYIVKGRTSTGDYESYVDGVTEETQLDYPMHVTIKRENSSGYVGGGGVVLEFSDMRGSIFKDQWISANTNAVNISTKNGTINILSPLHNFGFGEFTTRLNK
jgi:uncharacterized surface protein with fasciclin (FAS1) repeats